MFSYEELIDGYESPNQEDETDNNLIDKCNEVKREPPAVPPPPRQPREDYRLSEDDYRRSRDDHRSSRDDSRPRDSYRRPKDDYRRPKDDQNHMPPRLYKEKDDYRDYRPKQTSSNGKREYNFRGKKPYTFLSAVEMQQFEADLKRGDLSKQQLCQKYKVSISTTARFIRNYKEHGKLSVKKTDIASNDLVNQLKMEYPQLTVAQIHQKVQELMQKLPTARDLQRQDAARIKRSANEGDLTREETVRIKRK